MYSCRICCQTTKAQKYQRKKKPTSLCETKTAKKLRKGFALLVDSVKHASPFLLEIRVLYLNKFNKGNRGLQGKKRDGKSLRINSKIWQLPH